MLCSLGEGDGREAARFALRFSVEQNLDESAKKSFTDSMEKLFVERCRGYGTNVDVGSVLRGVLSLIREHQVRIDANFATLVINILCLESLSYQVCPSYNLLDFSQPLLQSYRRICYNADGTPKPRGSRAKWLNIWLSLMHVRKTKAEDAFFREQLMRRPPPAKLVKDLTH
jgi:predicted unusual protein kinase regulating ubiquinone biosynthesis (AarF/ABC1/UbiB family)